MRRACASVLSARLLGCLLVSSSVTSTLPLGSAIAQSTTQSLPPPLPVTPAPDSPDAAGRYYWLFDRVPTSFAKARRRATMDRWQLVPNARLADDEDASPPPDATDAVAELNAALLEARPWIDELEAATKLERATFGLQWYFGQASWAKGDPRERVLGSAVSATRILLYDACSAWHAGDRERSIARLVAAARFSAHLAQVDNNVMHSLLSSGSIGLTLKAIDDLMNVANPPLSDEERRCLGVALDLLTQDDPAALKRAWVFNTEESLRWVKSLDRDGTMAPELFEALRMMRNTRDIGDGYLFDVPVGSQRLKKDVWLVRLNAWLSTLRFTVALHPCARKATLAWIEHQSDMVRSRWHNRDFDAWFAALADATDAEPSCMAILVLGNPAGTRKTHWELAGQLDRVRARLRRDAPQAAQ